MRTPWQCCVQVAVGGKLGSGWGGSSQSKQSLTPSHVPQDCNPPTRTTYHTTLEGPTDVNHSRSLWTIALLSCEQNALEGLNPAVCSQKKKSNSSCVFFHSTLIPKLEILVQLLAGKDLLQRSQEMGAGPDDARQTQMETLQANLGALYLMDWKAISFRIPSGISIMWLFSS